MRAVDASPREVAREKGIENQQILINSNKTSRVRMARFEYKVKCLYDKRTLLEDILGQRIPDEQQWQIANKTGQQTQYQSCQQY
jgi:hypothetical protein